MPRQRFVVRQNDTKPDLQATLKDGDGVAINLTGATVKFSMRNQVDRTLKVNEGAVTLVTPGSGIVKYVWGTVAGDTDTPGLYDGEFEVTYGGGGIETVPNNGENALTIEVTRELA